MAALPRSIAAEARAAPELAAFIATAAPLVATAPRGDGHPVLVLPGLGGGDGSTQPMRWFLRRLGYRAHGWGLGRNMGPTAESRSDLAALLARLADRYEQPVSVVGWSLGGVYACALAARSAHRVRQVVTLGSPLRMAPNVPPAIPATSVYSRSDAIVPWTSSLLPAGPHRQNIEVRGSHLGLGHNPSVLIVVADRLALPVGRWRPYEPPRWARRWLPPERS